jgi:hypothetical protein
MKSNFKIGSKSASSTKPILYEKHKKNRFEYLSEILNKNITGESCNTTPLLLFLTDDTKKKLNL